MPVFSSPFSKNNKSNNKPQKYTWEAKEILSPVQTRTAQNQPPINYDEFEFGSNRKVKGLTPILKPEEARKVSGDVIKSEYAIGSALPEGRSSQNQASQNKPGNAKTAAKKAGLFAKKDKKAKINIADIGGPSNFKHREHAGIPVMQTPINSKPTPPPIKPKPTAVQDPKPDYPASPAVTRKPTPPTTKPKPTAAQDPKPDYPASPAVTRKSPVPLPRATQTQPTPGGASDFGIPKVTLLNNDALKSRAQMTGRRPAARRPVADQPIIREESHINKPAISPKPKNRQVIGQFTDRVVSNRGNTNNIGRS